MRRVVLALLLAWIAAGVWIYVGGWDGQEGPGPVEDAALADRTTRGGLPPGGGTRARAPAAPGLEVAGTGVSAAALVARLGPAHTPAQRAELSAWLRAHPESVGDLLRALAAAPPGYAAREWQAFFRDVFGPLHDLEARLAPGLLASLDAPSPPLFPPLGFGALRALAPLSAPTRLALDAWARAHRESPSLGLALDLVISNAERADEVLDLVQLMLTADAAGGAALHVPAMMRSIARLGERGRPLAPPIAAWVLAQRDDYGAAVDALVAVGADEPTAQRALLALLGKAGPGLQAAWAWIGQREDARDLLTAALDDPEPRVRLAAVSALQQRGGASREALLAAALPCLRSPDEEWRTRATWLVPMLADSPEQVVPTLEALLRSHDNQDWVTAGEMLRLLMVERGPPLDVSRVLEEPLRHRDARVRRMVVTALMRCPAEVAVPRLREALRDEDAAVRESATESLGTLARRDGAALAALREAAKLADAELSAAAQAWLDELERATEESGSRRRARR